MPGPASSLTRIFIVALVELLRRWQWNFFRLENEHLGNVDMYRVSHEVPLPYTVPARKEADDDDDDDEDGERRRKKRIGLKALGRFARSSQNPDAAIGASQDTTDAKARPAQATPTLAEAVSPRPESARSAALGKQRATDDAPFSDVRAADTLHSENDDVSARDGQKGSGFGAENSLLRRIRHTLVPDQGGLMAAGERLDEMGAAKGSQARDYEPRRVEPDRDSASQSSIGSSDEETEHERHSGSNVSGKKQAKAGD